MDDERPQKVRIFLNIRIFEWRFLKKLWIHFSEILCGVSLDRDRDAYGFLLKSYTVVIHLSNRDYLSEWTQNLPKVITYVSDYLSELENFLWVP